MNVRCALLTLTLLLAVASAQAEIYRWVDERGKVHFSDRSNSGGAQKLEIGKPETNSDGIDQQRRDAERKVQQERMLDAYREEREEREEDRLKAEAAEQQRSRNCAYARNRLRNYGNARLYQPLEDGGRLYLDDEERQQEIDRQKAAVRHWCDS